MRPKRSLSRAVIGVVLAAAFLFAVQPGTMAMPAPAMPAQHGVDCDAMDGMAMTQAAKPSQHQNVPAEPCKHMAICMGLLACYGVTAIAGDALVLPVPLAARAAHFAVVAPTGMTHPPEDPPPIA